MAGHRNCQTNFDMFLISIFKRFRLFRHHVADRQELYIRDDLSSLYKGTLIYNYSVSCFVSPT
jgi:hypothetical protein